VTTARFEIRPLVGWGRPVTPEDQRRPARTFKARWDDTISLLLREVEHLGGTLIAVQVDVTDGDIRRDGMLRARSRTYSPAVKISFDSRHGPLTYATDEYDHWQANVRAVALALVALRAVDRYGITRSGEQYRGWTQIGAAAAEQALTVDEACLVLADAAGVRPESLAVPEGVTYAYRLAARSVHPDAGGDPAVFRLITAARDVLLAGGAR
jgi:hypothetical protein